MGPGGREYGYVPKEAGLSNPEVVSQVKADDTERYREFPGAGEEAADGGVLDQRESVEHRALAEVERKLAEFDDRKKIVSKQIELLGLAHGKTLAVSNSFIDIVGNQNNFIEGFQHIVHDALRAKDDFSREGFESLGELVSTCQENIALIESKLSLMEQYVSMLLKMSDVREAEMGSQNGFVPELRHKESKQRLGIDAYAKHLYDLTHPTGDAQLH